MDRAERIRGRRSSIDAANVTEGDKPAKAVLYIGCRTEGKDDIHSDELAEWAAQGAVDVRWAFSRPSDGSAGKHVQDLMLEDRDELVDLFEQGANIYVCGSTDVGNAVREASKTMYLDRRREKIREAKESGEQLGPDAELDEDTAAERFFDQLRTKARYATDVFT